MKKRSWYVVAALIAAMVVIVGCAPQFAAAPEPGYDYAEEAEGAPPAPREVLDRADGERAAADEKAVSSGGGEYAAVERLIVRNAWIDMVVPDTQEALDAVTGMADRMGGFVVQASTSQYNDAMRASVTIRVPVEKLDAALGEMRGMATEVRSENVSGQDVTEEYVDLQSRLRNLEQTEKKLQEFLDEAEDTESALAVLQELTRITGEIEQIKGRMKYLEESAAMSMISAELTPDEIAQPIESGGWKPGRTLRNALQRLVNIMQGVVDAIIVIVLNVLPVLVVIAIPVVAVVLVIRAIRKRRRAKKAEKADEAMAETPVQVAED